MKTMKKTALAVIGGRWKPIRTSLLIALLSGALYAFLTGDPAYAQTAWPDCNCQAMAQSGVEQAISLAVSKCRGNSSQVLASISSMFLQDYVELCTVMCMRLSPEQAAAKATQTLAEEIVSVLWIRGYGGCKVPFGG